MSNRGLPLKKRLVQLLRRLRGGELNPTRLSRSAALGFFVGVQPIYGLHLPLCAVLCLLLRLDLFTAYLAANVSFAPIAPFLLAFEVELGSLLLTGRHAPFTVERAREVGVAGFALHAAVGAVLLGLALAVVGGAAVREIARRLHRRTPLAATIDRVFLRYATAPRRAQRCVAARLSTDPIVGLLAQRGSLGRVVDAGAGYGDLGLLLLELGSSTRIVGFDRDACKVGIARAAARGDLEFAEGSPEDWEWGTDCADTILMIDLLHHISLEQQDAAIRRAAAALAPGGRLLIRAVDVRPGIRGSLPRLLAWLESLRRGDRQRTLHFRPVGAIEATLLASGLECCVLCEGGTPLTSVLLQGYRNLSRSEPVADAS